MNKKIVTAVGSAIVGLAVAHTGQEAQASDSQELIVKSENKKSDRKRSDFKVKIILSTIRR